MRDSDGPAPQGASRRGLVAVLGALPTALLAGCSPVRVLNDLAPDRLAASGIAYGPDARQALDIYRPSGTGPFPTVVFLYGGSWDSGDRTMYRFVGGALAAAGFLTVIPDYRLYPAVRYPTFLDDCATATAWTHRHAGQWGGDGAPCWLMGHSAGAYNAAMLAFDPQFLTKAGMDSRRDLRGFVGLAGPYDFLPLTSPSLRAIFAPSVPLSQSQPIAHVDGSAPPALLLAGADDTVVDPANTRRMAARIAAAGGIVETRFYPGIGHREIIGAFGQPLRFLAPSLRDSLAFMRSPRERAS